MLSEKLHKEGIKAVLTHSPDVVFPAQQLIIRDLQPLHVEM